MGVVVDGWAASIKTYFRGVDSKERLFAQAESVVEFEIRHKKLESQKVESYKVFLL